MLIIGAGPCGLRAAIEAQLLGAKVVVIEKRDRISRNNVLHLWPFVIQDLRSLGAKKFFGKFCAGSIDHISKHFSLCVISCLIFENKNVAPKQPLLIEIDDVRLLCMLFSKSNQMRFRLQVLGRFNAYS